MGAVPKKKITSHRRGRRRQNIKLAQTNLGTCPQCQQPKPHHQACPECGTYKPQNN